MARQLILFCLLLALPTKAYAYLDPGTGGLLIQVIMGAVLAAGVTAKMWWRKVRSIFSRRSLPDRTDNR